MKNCCKQETNLIGKKVKKSSKRVSLLGEIDELNSFVGLARSFNKNSKIEKTLKKIQSYLFLIGTEIASSKPLIKEKDVREIEKEIEKYSSRLKKIKNFVYPAGSKLASLLHVCRTVARRVERNAFTAGKMNKHTLAFLNKLSDLFFEMARYANQIARKKEEFWKI